MLQRETALLEKTAAEQRKEAGLKASLEEYATMVSNNLNRISFDEKQKLLRIVLDRVVVKGWRVDLHYNIPLPKPTPPEPHQVSSQFDLRSMRQLSAWVQLL